MIFSIVAQLLAVSLTPFAHAQEVECWAPDGKTKADNETYVPCNKLGIEQDGVYSSCCNLDGDLDERDLCLTTGLCLNGNSLFRGYCTDQSWDSPACVKVCTDDENGGSSNDTVEITPCGDGTYCCGRENLGCCDTDRSFSLPTISSVVSENFTETAVVTEVAGASSAYKDATIGLAVVLGVAALAALLGALWLLKKNKALQSRLEESQQANQSQMHQTPHSQYVDPYLQQHEDDRGTEITAASSPRPTGYTHYKPPTSPDISEVDGHQQRYSELDATAMSPHNTGYAPGSPGLDRTSNATPINPPGNEQHIQ